MSTANLEPKADASWDAFDSLSESNTPGESDPYRFVPQSWKDKAHWLVWKYATRSGNSTKPPYNSRNGQIADAHAASTWTIFAAAVKASAKYNGIGFSFAETDYKAADFDGVVRNGVIDPFVVGILKLFPSYCEYSPSETGVHLVVESSIPLPKGNKVGNHEYGGEIYDRRSKKYFTVSGKKIEGLSNDSVLKIDDPFTIELLHFLVLSVQSDKHADDLRALWIGDMSGYNNDHSKADWHLLIHLKGFSIDPAKMKRAFLLSALGQREKATDRADYLDDTIAKLLSSDTELSVSNSKAPAREPEIMENETEPEIVDEPLPEFPPITGSITELADALCPDIPREFKTMAAITRVGLAISGKVQLEGEPHLQPRFYTCFIAEAGRGKTAAIKETRIIDSGYREVPSVDSAPALVDAFAELKDSPRCLLLCPDEAVDLFEKGKTSRDSRNSLFTELLKLYEDNVTGNRARRNPSPIEIHDAYLAILCGATPSGYDGMWMGSRGASGGLQSRFIPIATTAPPIPAKQRPSDMQRVHAAVGRIRQQTDSCGATVITMTPDAEEAFKAWWEAVPKDKPSTVRVEALVKRFLMVLAVTNDTDVIGSGLMATGIAFGDYIITVRDKFNPADAYSPVQAFEQKIEACHEKQGVPLTHDRCRKLVHPARYPGGYGDFNKAHGNLVRAGRLTVQGKTQRAPKYGLDD